MCDKRRAAGCRPREYGKNLRGIGKVREIIYIMANEAMPNNIYIGQSPDEAIVLEMALLYLGKEDIAQPFDLVYAAYAN
jgi:hypothetical protein